MFAVFLAPQKNKLSQLPFYILYSYVLYVLGDCLQLLTGSRVGGCVLGLLHRSLRTGLPEVAGAGHMRDLISHNRQLLLREDPGSAGAAGGSRTNSQHSFAFRNHRNLSIRAQTELDLISSLVFV